MEEKSARPEPPDMSSSDESESLEMDEQDAHEESDAEEESLTVVSLLDKSVFPDAASMLTHCKTEHGFDFLAIRDRLNLDFHGSVKLINFVRQRVQDGIPLPEEIQEQDLSDERFLRPVLPDDALIMSLDELPPAAVTEPLASSLSPQPSSTLTAPPPSAGGHDELLRRNRELEEQLEILTKKFTGYRLAVEQTLDRRWGDEGEGAENGQDPVKAVPDRQPEEEGRAPAPTAGGSEHYWESYAHNEIHETMLKDTVRTNAYRDFIYSNKHLFAGKVVLDIGCGTGVLSLFCAKAGAKEVIAVDASAIIDKARENVFRNGLGDTIRCLHGQIEEVTLPVDSVDIIVSEWMGYCLLYEAMLPSVIWARDRYLKPGGLLVPSHASLWTAPVADAEYIGEHIDFWRDVYGFDMTAMQADIYKDVRVQHMAQTSLGGSAHCFRHLDLYTAEVRDLSFTVPWTSILGSSGAERLDGFLIWFDMFFATTPAEARTVTDTTSAQEWVVAHDDRVAFTTGPGGKETHWKQGLLLTGQPNAPRSPGKDSLLRGEIEYSIPDDYARGLNIRLTWASDTVTSNDKRQSQSWSLS